MAWLTCRAASARCTYAMMHIIHRAISVGPARGVLTIHVLASTGVT
jgi:hypothetical protein